MSAGAREEKRGDQDVSRSKRRQVIRMSTGAREEKRGDQDVSSGSGKDRES